MANIDSFRPRGGGSSRKDDGPRINHLIRAKEIRLIGADGELVGVVPISEGMKLAEQEGLDLVEISPNAEPPVCKVLDYGKYRYMEQKKAKQARKNQKVVHIKELKIRPGIEKHDYEVKMKSARRFLEEGDKVKVTLRFRGREMSHMEHGLELLQRVQADLADISQTESPPNKEGRQMIMVLAPK